MFYVILNPDIFQCACGGREKIASCLIHDTSLALPERLDSLQLVIAFRLRNIQVLLLFFFIFFQNVLLVPFSATRTDKY